MLIFVTFCIETQLWTVTYFLSFLLLGSLQHNSHICLEIFGNLGTFMIYCSFGFHIKIKLHLLAGTSVLYWKCLSNEKQGYKAKWGCVNAFDTRLMKGREVLQDISIFWWDVGSLYQTSWCMLLQETFMAQLVSKGIWLAFWWWGW